MWELWALTGDNRVRVHIIGVVILSLFGALFARLWYLQVAAGGSYAAAAESNRIRVVQEEAPRGRILDRNGRVLVDNRTANAILVDRTISPKERETVVGRLAELLGISDKQINARINDPRISPYTAVPVAVDVPIDAVTYVAEHKEDFPGVSAEPIAIRDYPNGSLAAHVLGYVGEISDQELKTKTNSDYQIGDTIGKAGVEASFENDLRGKPTKDYLEIDSKGNVIRTVKTVPDTPGNDVTLTLDADVQKVAEDSLQQGIESARKVRDTAVKDRFKNFAADGGAVVVLDATDGSVVAMASYPSFAPQDFTQGIPTNTWTFLNDPANHYPLDNRALQGLYPAGSTFKPFSAVAGMDSGLINAGTTINDTGKLKVADRTFSNAGNVAYGPVNLRKALTVSSDVYFYNVGAELWKRGNKGDPTGTEIQKVARSFGFDKPTGIDLPSEPQGRIPDPAWKKQVHAQRPDAFPYGEWLPGDNVNLAVGQGDVLVTPLQLANAYATLANGGTLYQPRIAERVLNAQGDVVQDIKPDKVRSTGLQPSVRNAILPGLVGVVNDSAGTAHGAFTGFPLSQFTVAGKTGTAQVAGKENTSLFVAMTPTDNPKYVVAVVVEEAGYGAAVAAPIARRVIEGIDGQPLSTVHVVPPPAGN